MYILYLIMYQIGSFAVYQKGQRMNISQHVFMCVFLWDYMYVSMSDLWMI